LPASSLLGHADGMSRSAAADYGDCPMLESVNREQQERHIREASERAGRVNRGVCVNQKGFQVKTGSGALRWATDTCYGDLGPLTRRLASL
jgi:hypothetical protein